MIVAGGKNVSTNEPGTISFGFTNMGANKQSLFSRMSPTNKLVGGADSAKAG